MRNTDERKRKLWTRCWGAAAAFSIVLLLNRTCMAQIRNQDSFASSQEACQALFAAVQRGDEANIEEVLGGGKEMISTDDTVDDQHDRQIFIEKYQQMHRLVQEPDGKTVLYIGAENWPFPVPLVFMGGKWHFDSDSGAEEVIFRRIGQNEMQVIDICRRLESDADLEAGDNGPNREPAVAYALRLIEAGTKGPSAEASSGRPPTAPLHGYYFRQMEPGKPTADSLIVAYPAEYRSSGVMTFIVNQRGDVFQKDLGPQTVTLVGAMNTWRSDRTWKIVN